MRCCKPCSKKKITMRRITPVLKRTYFHMCNSTGVFQPYSPLRHIPNCFRATNAYACLHLKSSRMKQIIDVEKSSKLPEGVDISLEKPKSFPAISGVKKSKKKVIVLAEEGEEIGLMPLQAAQRLAHEKDLKLTLVEDTTHTYVICRLMVRKEISISKADKSKIEATPKNVPEVDDNEEIFLMGQRHEPLGVMTRGEAKKAAEQGLPQGGEVTVVCTDETVKVPKVIYQLTSNREIIEISKNTKIKKTGKTPSSKLMQLTTKISDQDLNVKTRNLLEWLAKGHQVKVVIKGGMADQGRLELMKKVTNAAVGVSTVSKAKDTPQDLSFVLKPNMVDDKLMKSQSSNDDKSLSSPNDKLKPLTMVQLKQLTAKQPVAKRATDYKHDGIDEESKG